MQSERPVAECEELEKLYRTPASAVHALRGITAAFPRSALTAVAGPSGSGKSSLLRLLAGLDRPSAGRLEVDRVRVDRASARSLRRLRRRSVGYLFQRASDNFFPYLTVDEHVRMATRGRMSRAVVDVPTCTSEVHWIAPHDEQQAQKDEPVERFIDLGRVHRQRRGRLRAEEARHALLVEGRRARRELHRERPTILIAVTHSAELAALFPQRMEMNDGKLVGF